MYSLREKAALPFCLHSATFDGAVAVAAAEGCGSAEAALLLPESSATRSSRFARRASESGLSPNSSCSFGSALALSRSKTHEAWPATTADDSGVLSPLFRAATSPTRLEEHGERIRALAAASWRCCR